MDKVDKANPRKLINDLMYKAQDEERRRQSYEGGGDIANSLITKGAAAAFMAAIEMVRDAFGIRQKGNVLGYSPAPPNA